MIRHRFLFPNPWLNMLIRKIFPLLLVPAIIIFLIPACNSCQGVKSFLPPPGKVISFEHVQHVTFGGGYYYRSEETAQIWVINSLRQYNRPQGIEWKPNPPNPQLSEPPPEISNFDFSEYFIIMVFNGYRSYYAESMKIERIRQDKDTVNIWVHFDDGAEYSNPIFSSQYTVLKINREEMTQFGEITFTLIDQNGQERAKATYKVSN